MKDYSAYFQWGPPSSKNWLAHKCYNIGLCQIMLKSDHIMPWISQKFTYYKLLNSWDWPAVKRCVLIDHLKVSLYRKKKKNVD